MGEAAQPLQREGPNSVLAHGPVSEWASTHGIAFAVDQSGEGFALKGKVGGKPWSLQLSPPTRNYIFGEEVRALVAFPTKPSNRVMPFIVWTISTPLMILGLSNV